MTNPGNGSARQDPPRHHRAPDDSPGNGSARQELPRHDSPRVDSPRDADRHGVPIRRAVREDAAELGRLLSPLGYPIDASDVLSVWDAWEAEGNFALVVADDKGRLAGVITLHSMTVLHRPAPVGRITSLAVDPAARGRGLGRALMAAAEAALADAGCRIVEVTSHERRGSAHAFYRHFGYDRTSHRFARTLIGPPAPE